MLLSKVYAGVGHGGVFIKCPWLRTALYGTQVLYGLSLMHVVCTYLASRSSADVKRQKRYHFSSVSAIIPGPSALSVGLVGRHLFPLSPKGFWPVSEQNLIRQGLNCSRFGGWHIYETNILFLLAVHFLLHETFCRIKSFPPWRLLLYCPAPPPVFTFRVQWLIVHPTIKHAVIAYRRKHVFFLFVFFCSVLSKRHTFKLTQLQRSHEMDRKIVHAPFS